MTNTESLRKAKQIILNYKPSKPVSQRAWDKFWKGVLKKMLKE